MADDPGPASGTSEPWKDAAGNDVANILSAIGFIDSVPGFNPADAATESVILEFTVPQATAQGWLDNGFGGMALLAIDGSDLSSRFNFSNGGSAIDIPIVPEPSTAALLLVAAAGCLTRRMRQ